MSLSCGSEGCVAAQSLGQNLSCGLELVANESQPKEPGAHRILGVFVLLGLCAGELDFLRHLAKGQAKLNVALELPGMKAVEFSIGWCVELEQSELDGPLGKGCVIIQHAIPR